MSYKKIKYCTLIASHDRSGIRMNIYNEISKIAPVDCPGSFLHNDDSLHKQYANNKAIYLQQYKFNICPEKSIIVHFWNSLFFVILLLIKYI
jgi:hypothetical protein